MDTADIASRFGTYIQRLADAIAHKDRVEPLVAYLSGLTLPGERKSVEPIAARIDPFRTSARHQSLLHFLGQAPWDDQEVLRVARNYAFEQMLMHSPLRHLVIDDTGFPKKGRNSVGVANQYCGILGKNANSQVTVSISAANDIGSIPVAYRLYLPEKWANDKERRAAAKVPSDVEFAPKWKLALQLVEQVLGDGLPKVPILADAGFGDVTDFRSGLTDLGLPYSVGVSHTTSVWPPGMAPLPPVPWSGRGRQPKNLRRSEEHKPVTAKELANSLPQDAWQLITWRQGTAGPMVSRFARLRLRPAHRDMTRTEPWPEQYLLIEWPESEPEPTKYWLSTEELPLTEHVASAKGRWRVERDYQELKTEFGLDKYQGRGWRGFHHHWTLCIAAYAFTVAERARLSPPEAGPVYRVQIPPLPEGYRPRGAPTSV